MQRTEQASPWRTVVAWLRLPHFVPVVAVLVATAALALVVAGGWPGAGQMLRLLGAMLGAQIVIGVTNDLIDAERDAVAKPHKPIPAGLVSRRAALLLGTAGLTLMINLSATFGPTSLALCALGTATGVSYSLWFKQSVWSWIPYLIALPLVPIWVWQALDSLPGALLAIYPLGFPAVLAVQLAQSLPDIAGDRATGVETLAVRLGSRRARLVCWGGMILSGLMVAAAAVGTAEHPVRANLAALLSAVLVGCNWLLWKRDEDTGLPLCFPLMAAATIILGIGWLTSAGSG